MKSLDDNFRDWELEVFGCGYGTGEGPVMIALSNFLRLTEMPGEGGYDYRVLEENLSPQVAWLLINTLCHADIICYGTSPRFGFLTEQGAALKRYMADKPADVFETILHRRDEDYVECFPYYCNCSDDPKEQCKNPFWKEVKNRNGDKIGNRRVR